MAERRARSVRFRVTALAVLAVTLVLAGTAALLLRHQRDVLTDGLDESLALELQDLARLDRVPPVLGAVVDDDGVAQVVAGDEVVASTRNLTGRAPIAPAPPPGERTTTEGHVLDDEPGFRIVSRHARVAGRPVVLHVGGTTEDIDEAVGALARALAFAVPLVVALLGALVWVLVGRTLAPVEAMRAEVAAIGAAADLDRRVAEPGTGDEIDELAGTMNAMLGRVERSIRLQQQFVADASHELRTPLTRMRSEIEVDLAHPSADGREAVLRSLLEEATGMEQLVEDLLLLARSDAGATTVPDRAVDLDEVVWACARRIERPGVRIDTAGLSAAQVTGDEAQLSRAVGNLLVNAVGHARGTVAVELREDGDDAVLVVTDDGPGIPAAAAERVFERFTRLDDARSRVQGGTGLGLAIARDIVERHGGAIAVDVRYNGGARLAVRLPLR